MLDEAPRGMRQHTHRSHVTILFDFVTDRLGAEGKRTAAAYRILEQ
jgi:hypothetical protein